VRWVECVKCAEGVWCSCYCSARGYVGAGVLLEWKRFTVHTLGCWWWAYKCPKHVEHIISAIKRSVASSWFSSLRLYYDARTNIHQINSWTFFVLCDLSIFCCVVFLRKYVCLAAYVSPVLTLVRDCNICYLLCNWLSFILTCACVAFVHSVQSDLLVRVLHYPMYCVQLQGDRLPSISCSEGNFSVSFFRRYSLLY